MGFAASGYCPGTGAAVLGQLNRDGLFMILGMLAGSMAFAMASARLHVTIQRWGERGKVLLPDLFQSRLKPFSILFGLMLVAALWFLERYTVR